LFCWFGLQPVPTGKEQVIQAPDNTLFHFLERFAMSNASNSESSVHHFVSECVYHVLGIPLPNGYRKIVKRKTTEIFKILDYGYFNPQSTNADVLGEVHRVL